MALAVFIDWPLSKLNLNTLPVELPSYTSEALLLKKSALSKLSNVAALPPSADVMYTLSFVNCDMLPLTFVNAPVLLIRTVPPVYRAV